MHIEYYGKKEPSIILIEDFYTPEELTLIWEELDFLTSQNKFLLPSSTASAGTEDDATHLVKHNRGIFLDEYYGTERHLSNILNVNRKIFLECDKFIELDPIFRYIVNSNTDTTLISYYEDGDYYGAHTDQSNITILSWFFKEPKQFSGGKLILNDFNLELEIESNMVLIMPGSYTHMVEPVQLSGDKNSGYGRYNMAQFINNTIFQEKA